MFSSQPLNVADKRYWEMCSFLTFSVEFSVINIIQDGQVYVFRSYE